MSTTLRVPNAILAFQSFYHHHHHHHRLLLPASANTSSLSSKADTTPLELPENAPAATTAAFSHLDKHRGDGELLTLYVLGAALSGHRDLAHGGLVATLLDQQMGSLVIADSSAIVHPRTVFCNIRYLGATHVPGAVMVKAWKTRVEGRKV